MKKNLLSKEEETKEIKENLIDSQRAEFIAMQLGNSEETIPIENSDDSIPELEVDDNEVEDYMDESERPNFDVIEPMPQVDDCNSNDITINIDEVEIEIEPKEEEDFSYVEDDDFSYEYEDEIEDDEDFYDEYSDEMDYDYEVFEDGFMSFESEEDIRLAYKENIDKRTIKESADDEAITELRLFIDNDADLYKRQTTPMIDNVKRKIKNGKYDKNKAPKLWMYLVDNGAKKYAKEYSKPSDWNVIFPKNVRQKVAYDLAEYYFEEISLGNYDN